MKKIIKDSTCFVQNKPSMFYLDLFFFFLNQSIVSLYKCPSGYSPSFLVFFLSIESYARCSSLETYTYYTGNKIRKESVYVTRHRKRVLMPYENMECSNQPAHPRILIRALLVSIVSSILDSVIGQRMP